MIPVDTDIDFLDNYAPYLINKVSTQWNSEFNRQLKARKLVNLSQWRVLAVVNARPNLSLTELINFVSMDQPTVSRIVDKLVEMNLIVRSLQSDDRRFLSLSLTDAGRDVIKKIWPVAMNFYEAAMADLSKGEVEMLVNLLRKSLKVSQ